MDEKDLIDGLRGLTLAEPRIGFDLDELADRAARRHRTRRAILTTAASTAVAASVLAGALVLTHSGTNLPMEPGRATPRTVVPPFERLTRPTPPKSANYPPADIAGYVPQLQASLQQILPRLLLYPRDLRIEVKQEFAGQADSQVSAKIQYRNSNGPATVILIIRSAKDISDGSMPFGDARSYEPSMRLTDGSLVYFEPTLYSPDAVEIPTARNARHYRNDDTVMFLYNTNNPGIEMRPSLPLSDQQIIELFKEPLPPLR